MTNGEHGTQTEEHVFKDRIAWMDYWLRGTDHADLDFKTGEADLPAVFGPRATPTTTSRVILGNQGEGKAVGEIESDGFPLGQTEFTDVYMSARRLAHPRPPGGPARHARAGSTARAARRTRTRRG